MGQTPRLRQLGVEISPCPRELQRRFRADSAESTSLLMRMRRLACSGPVVGGLALSGGLVSSGIKHAPERGASWLKLKMHKYFTHPVGIVRRLSTLGDVKM
jgi:hypothetical protein